MMYVVAGKALGCHRRGMAGAGGIGSAVAATPLASARFAHVDSHAISALRRNLSQDARELLVLRVDRGLEWSDIALVLLGESATPVQVLDEAKRLEKRFRSIRDELARNAINLGLLPV